MSQKKLLCLLFIVSAIATLLLSNPHKSYAQSDYSSFLSNVRDTSAANCRQYGSGCSDCARDIANRIIQQNGITDQRVKQDIYNAAISGCG